MVLQTPGTSLGHHVGFLADSLLIVTDYCTNLDFGFFVTLPELSACFKFVK